MDPREPKSTILTLTRPEGAAVRYACLDVNVPAERALLDGLDYRRGTLVAASLEVTEDSIEAIESALVGLVNAWDDLGDEGDRRAADHCKAADGLLRKVQMLRREVQ
jgi:hypothetical protein